MVLDLAVQIRTELRNFQRSCGLSSEAFTRRPLSWQRQKKGTEREILVGDERFVAPLKIQFLQRDSSATFFENHPLTNSFRANPLRVPNSMTILFGLVRPPTFSCIRSSVCTHPEANVQVKKRMETAYWDAVCYFVKP